MRVFSPQTLAKFEDASASIPLRALDRAFANAELHAAPDPGGGSGGARRTQFRRYAGAVDQRDLQQLNRFGNALGALIGEVAESKQNFLIQAAEHDGFVYADGVFRPAESAPNSFGLTSSDDFALIEEYRRRLHVTANDRPNDAIDGARELVESVCLTVLGRSGKSLPPQRATLETLAELTLDALHFVVADNADALTIAAVIRTSLRQLVAVVTDASELRSSASRGRAVEPHGVESPHARLAVGAAVTFASFVIDAYVERAALVR